MGGGEGQGAIVFDGMLLPPPDPPPTHLPTPRVSAMAFSVWEEEREEKIERGGKGEGAQRKKRRKRRKKRKRRKREGGEEPSIT